MGNRFKCKINEIYNDIPNLFGIADDILVIGYEKDGADHDEAVYSVLKWCQDGNLKLNKDKYHFRCTSNTILSQSSVKGRHPPRSTKGQSTD